MNRSLVAIAALCLLTGGCGPKLQEKDLYGDWSVDNSTLPKTQNANYMANATLTLMFDHSFRMSFAPVTLKGSWSYAENRVKITPATLVMTVQNKPVEFAISELTEKFGPIFSQTPEGQKELEGLEAAGKPWDLQVSKDGRALATADGLTWRKSQTP